MLNCPKCGGFDIAGPRYIKRFYNNEALVFDCRKCGYSEDHPTKDAEKTVSPAGLRSEYKGGSEYPKHYDSQGYCDNPGRGY